MLTRVALTNLTLLCFHIGIRVFLKVFYSLLRNHSDWDVVEPLPSYVRGIELRDRRYGSLITGNNLTDVVITGMFLL